MLSLMCALLLIIIMKDSQQRNGNVRIERLTEQEDEQNETEEAFENNNKIYQLQSCINDANIQIQKLQIQLQRDRRDFKKSIESLLNQKNSMTENFNNLILENKKLATMHEAEKTSRKRLTVSHKMLNKVIDFIVEKIGVTDKGNLDELQSKIQELIASKLQAEKRLQNSMISIEKMKIQKQQKIKGENIRFEEAIRLNNSNSKATINSLQREIYEIKVILDQKESLIRRLQQQNSSLKRQSECFQEKQAKLIELTRQNFSQQEMIRKYKMKEDVWSITKDKLNQQKAKNEQIAQDLKSKLQYSIRKNQLNQQRRSQEQIKRMRLQTLLQQCKAEIKKYEERLIYSQQQCEQLKKKIHLCDIYKEKYTRLHSKIKQSEEKAQNFVSIADQYADQIQQLQNTIINSEESRERLQQQRQTLKKYIQEKQMENALLSMKLCHQTSAIEEKNKQIHILKMDCVENSKKIAIQSMTHQKPENRYQKHNQLQKDERNHQIISHFQSILLNEIKLRRKVTNQLANYKQKVIKLNEDLVKMQKQLKEQKQQRQLLLYESKKLSRIRSQTHKSHQLKLTKIKQTYRELQRVNSENIAFSHDKKQSVLVCKLRICSCFSYSIGSHSSPFHFNKQSSSQRERQNRRLRESSSSIHHLQILERINNYRQDISSSQTEHKTGDKKQIY